MMQYDQEADFEAFKNLLPELLETQKGRFVVMHDQRIAETFDNEANALEWAVKTHGYGKFIVQEVHNRRLRPLSYSLAIS